MPCEICHDFRGIGELRKEEEPWLPQNRLILNKDLLWESFKASAKSCYICELLIKGCRGCFAQNGIDEGAIVSFEIRFYYQLYEDQLGDVDKTICFLLNDESYFDVQVFATEDADCPVPNAWESVPTSRRTSCQTDSPQALETIKGWLASCHDRSHDECEVPEDTPLPKRVIDVDGHGDVRLIETQGRPARYICLSHCWGLERIITTTTATIHKRKKQIALSELSKTFRDAVEMTRKLGVRYIWIDSLCIIQDSLADWEIESAKMSSIYTYAYVTLAATQSSNGRGGLFKPTLDFDVSGTTPDGEAYRLFFRDRIDHHLDIQGMPDRNDPEPHVIGHSTVSYHPLLTRAWVYQERLLSPRVLHFGPYELFMECRASTQCECDDIAYHGSSDEAPVGLIKLLYSEAIYPTNDYGEEWHIFAAYYLARVWRTLICNYTALGITKDSDRLPAIGGLARNLGEVRKIDYIAGLWENTINDDLLWYVLVPETRKTPRPRPATAPTWSWASVGTWVSYWDHMYFYDPEEDVTEDQRLPCQHFSKVERWHLDPAGVDEFGQMRQATITITGLVAEGFLESEPRGDGNTLQYVKFPNARLKFHADYVLSHGGEDQVPLGTKLTCLRMSQLQEGRRDHHISLVLRSIDETNNVYERIGALVVSATPPGDPLGGVFDAAVERTVTIR
ncbi:heterokaryon incompatibility protein-domain-containing protein [Thelonectria olida]|uniref:Heterokaryon incompatibility protein-domain-containing protein n=1 Tax=Thelonectria olida TaxID=1576542 RepID=A0A9P8VVD8_9HYPO|nr:heterokaryon incompatibility protein-domain-containing protein [Thelonectria olida]